MEGQSIVELNEEILRVGGILLQAASDFLPAYRSSRRPNKIANAELKTLCQTSKKAWKRWNSGGRPSNGPLYEEKKSANRNVRNLITRLRAKSERSRIQRRDQMFKTREKKRFKPPTKPSTTCRRLKTTNGISSNPSKIASEFCNYFHKLASSQLNSNQCTDTLSHLLNLSYTHPNSILDDLFDEEEISLAINRLWCGKAAGPDKLQPEHLKYGGHTLVLWLRKLFNRLISLEDIPSCLKDGLVTPIYKKQGKDPLQVSSYRGITISSVLAKILQTLILTRMSDVIAELNLPDILQTAYQKGLSCSDATFATQEALIAHLREGGHPYLCLFDLEKAFELPILLKRLFDIGIRGRCWRIIHRWYTTASSRVKINGSISDSYPITRGVKQGSVLSPILFLMVIDTLLGNLRQNKAGISMYGTYIGGAAHADDLRTIAASKDSIVQQYSIINQFTEGNHLRLNLSKTEVIKISHHLSDPELIHLPQLELFTTSSAKCLGVWWQHNLMAERSVKENITRARKAFFAQGAIDAFLGHLNPMSSSSVFETCVVPVLLYGCETWLLDQATLSSIESFQVEIGRRILKLLSFFSTHLSRMAFYGIQNSSEETSISGQATPAWISLYKLPDIHYSCNH